ncbi:hypothetical protein P175DRAFT_0505729 [Aspergillus ochraceoroseus IBT 24754]|uniref:Uncharacterized protein n=3 Tax=Aspergillus subgen. Nidulantes TaxID=2720870 RepID=A0A0F8U8Z2_9EURO|nr:uncharacterized protein P175DRAFT_0505729 [Aspergillus ochraceoroseus IBT 24754]KKK12624.1 hypothetical protein AOCH_002314 [Aspergillus ochraceoroseus]KKK16033.1 hypothetical protein ARAM_004610 [Aspergillus rambellii]PTU23971.1 hypothetical protein P175DRAFT_0505729 [Aspergillus ochraceoroseus IBT 24754]
MGPPYQKMTAVLGEVPTPHVDVPIDAVFIGLFVVGAASHMTLFRLNLRRGHKFIPSAATFGFCMTRITANALRIAWAYHPSNVPLSIAAQIFVAAGVVILFILNLLYAQRILRALHPTVGWSRFLSTTMKLTYLLIILTLVAVITATVQSFYTLNRHTGRIDLDLLRYGTTYFAFVATLPLFIMAYVGPRSRHPHEKMQPFGRGGIAAKMGIVTAAAMLLSLGAWFRAATIYLAPHSVASPAWYQTRPCFYVFNFTVEIIVVYIFLLTRVDRRFHVPDGSSKLRQYTVNA